MPIEDRNEIEGFPEHALPSPSIHPSIFTKEKEGYW